MAIIIKIGVQPTNEAAEEKQEQESAPTKINEKAAGYMELPGAQKDGGCRIVDVAGGVSHDLGCCNLFDPEEDAIHFSCGNCEYVTDAGISGKTS